LVENETQLRPRKYVRNYRGGALHANQNIMNNKQRMLTAMAGKKPDHVPVFISSYWDYEVRAANGDPFEYAYGDLNTRLHTELAFLKRHFNAGLHRLSPGHVRRTKGTIIKEQNCRHVLDDSGRPLFDLPPRCPLPWTPLIEKYLPELVCFSAHPPETVKRPEDIARIVDIDIASRPAFNSDEFVKAMVPEISGKILIATSGCALFPHTRRCLGGTEQCLLALMDTPALVESVMEALLTRYDKMIAMCAKAGSDAMWCGAYDEGADVVSPGLWRKMILPRHKKLVAMIHSRNMKAICWFLGDCLPLVEDLAEAGYDALILEQGRGAYSSDVGAMRKRVGNELCLSGWLPEIAVLKDDRETIRRHIHEQYESAGTNGAFLFATSILDSNVNPETIDFVCKEIDSLK